MRNHRSIAPKRFHCRHIFTDGHRCGSPSLLAEHQHPGSPEPAHEDFCYYHHTTRRPTPGPTPSQTLEDPRQATFDLPSTLDERPAIQLALAAILRRIAANALDPRRAGLLLYGLQTASLNLPRHTEEEEERRDLALVDRITTHPIHGPLAPAAEYSDRLPSRYKSIAERIYDSIEDGTFDEVCGPEPGSEGGTEPDARPGARDVLTDLPTTLPTLQAAIDPAFASEKQTGTCAPAPCVEPAHRQPRPARFERVQRQPRPARFERARLQPRHTMPKRSGALAPEGRHSTRRVLPSPRGC